MLHCRRERVWGQPRNRGRSPSREASPKRDWREAMEMRNGRNALLAIGVLAASFAGGVVGQWAFRGADAAYAASKQREVAPVIRARSFEVVNAKGDLLVRLTATPDGPMLSMRKAKGKDIIG